ncbi:M43 family zinc metalloprotease [Arundinibacter roseus]|uniref:Peptidase M43 pregnancy-associated plasma-A domain-containing protein n=1 Tax=Arundinibacter roseus TaxID=2070510 RepID=A0A4R4K214_9BACT|nr:M43 family zinc metalloprotease [Arundinibacter roseus]TDB60049.1 hypothetical protein EZE20_21500 [Arundinibacter roseus]
MRNTPILSTLGALLLTACQPMDLSPEEVYQNSIVALELTSSTDIELPLGSTLDLTDLLTITYKENQTPASLPTRAIRVVANQNALASSVFSATTAGTYTLQVKVGDKVSNTISVNVLPYALVRIPVVFHTVNSTLSAAQINRLVNNLTDAFRNRWNPYRGAKDAHAVDNFVEFYAAPTDPSQRTLAVAGLDAIKATRQTFTTEQAVEEAWNAYWNPKNFLNIWVFNIARAESVSGFAYITPVTRSLPGSRLVSAARTSPDLPYGIFFNQSEVNSTVSSTLAHEAGHVLGLHHVFDGNGDESNGCSRVDPDYCTDTPFYDRKGYVDNYRNLRQRRQACNGVSYESNNIMDYYLSYENSFTRQQRERIRHTLTYGLWVPQGTNSRARQEAGEGFVKKPDDYRYVPPEICALESH